MIKRLFKFVIWPVKKIVLLPFKFLLYTLLIFVILILFFQYRADYQVDSSPLSKIEYENLAELIQDFRSRQKDFSLKNYEMSPFILTE